MGNRDDEYDYLFKGNHQSKVWVFVVWALSQTVNKMYTFQLFWLETQELESQTYSQDLQEMNLTWSLNPPSEWNLQPDQYR